MDRPLSLHYFSVWIFLAIVVLPGCGMVAFSTKEFATQTVMVGGVELGEAFDQAQKAAAAIGLKIRSKDKIEGTFVAWSHQPFIEVKELHFSIRQTEPTTLVCTVKAKSTKDDQAVLRQFLADYRQRVNLLQ